MTNTDSTFQTDARNLVRNDPLLKNLFNSSGTTQDTFRAQSIGALAPDGTRARIYSGVNWIKIPTLKDESDSNTATHISMLSVKTYTAPECVNIKTALRNKYIFLSGYGDLAVWTSGLGGTATMHLNTIIHSSVEITTIRSTPPSSSNSESNRTTREKRFLTPTTSYLFSPDLRWIVYKVPGKRYSAATAGATIQDGSSSSTNPPVYVLLYNTMHRRNFQDVYVKMMQHSWNSQQGGRASCVSAPNAGCVDAAYDNTPFSTDYDSVHNTIVKYCNAFKEGNGGASGGRPLKTYGDPSCAIVVDSRLATMNFIHRNNFTKDSLEVQYYGDRRAYETAYNLLVNKQSAAAHVLMTHCVTNRYTVRPQQNDAIAFLRVTSGLVKSGTSGTSVSAPEGVESDSFVQQYVNHFMKFTNLFTILTVDEKSQPHTGRTGLNKTTYVNGHIYNNYGCSYPTGMTIVECGINIDVGGSADISQNEFSQICGGTVEQMEEEDFAALQAALAAYNAENRDSGLGSELFIYFIIIIAVLILVGAGLFFVLKKK